MLWQLPQLSRVTPRSTFPSLKNAYCLLTFHWLLVGCPIADTSFGSRFDSHFRANRIFPNKSHSLQSSNRLVGSSYQIKASIRPFTPSWPALAWLALSSGYLFFPLCRLLVPRHRDIILWLLICHEIKCLQSGGMPMEIPRITVHIRYTFTSL